MPASAREYDLLLENASQVASMKILSAFIALSLIGVSVNARAAEAAKDLERDQQQVAALAKEVQAQQTTIADNQKKIDEKLAAIAEALRQAKIYSTRAR
jgi:uncharacterized protein YlxW (UPF0749 family)